MGCEYVLITGTHENTSQVINNLYGTDGVIRTDSWDRLPGSFHGSGCTLASAIAASLANGLPLAEGVYEAQEYTWQSLKAGFRPGMGQYLPDRLFWARDETEAEEGSKVNDTAGNSRLICNYTGSRRYRQPPCDDAAGAGRRSAVGPIP